MRIRRAMRAISLAVVGAVMLFAIDVASSRAQEQSQQQDKGQSQQQPPQTSAPPASNPPAKRGQAKTPSDTDDPHKYDAFNAEKDIEVGTFYLHKGDLDAAIPRFEEAASLRPNYGKPRLLLAEAYEKKKDPETALKYYKEYLKVYPNAPDAKKVQKKIEKLEGK
jgi:tetratricopeptide (TPR) repeat protein